ncbi:hypothetical protein GCM10009718_11750 [Isoptericola halotolerans]|uniref:Ribosomal protein S27E n=1 Tax=Isoptericola halotolerans TaxID=300560 RepID=A0ABX1ZZN4_9MICO|nr:DUF6510 family protein [Isoptericola halotolerans]NOV95904.1 ribosomal protein S27E [Isoptericola halotolerans]
MLDGNVLAGSLAEVWALDVTVATGRCAGCADVAVLARAVVFDHPMGQVVRCRGCGGVLMVVVERPDGVQVSARGLAWVRG